MNAVSVECHTDRIPSVDPVQAAIGRIAAIRFSHRSDPVRLSEGAAARFRQIAFTDVFRGYAFCVNECYGSLDRAESELVAVGLIEVGQRWPIPLDGPWSAHTARLTAAGKAAARVVCDAERAERADRAATMSASDYSEWFRLASCDLRNRDERRIPATFSTAETVRIETREDSEGPYAAAFLPNSPWARVSE